jgi:hypothetical protein
MKRKLSTCLTTGLLILSASSIVWAVDETTVQQIQDVAATARTDAAEARNKVQGNDTKITGLNDNIADLQQQIDNIQLTPGPEGPEGPAVAESVYTVTDTATSDGICNAMIVEVWCDAGDVLLGGGCWGTADQWYFRVNSRRPGDEGWTCRPVRNAANSCEPTTVTVSAICSDITP